MSKTKKQKEIVHVMLKPDALEFGLKKKILKEITKHGYKIVMSKKLVLNLWQIESIYSNFEDTDAKPAVLAFYISKPTEHFVFIGEKGLHDHLLEIKGSMISKTGIRGKYVSRKKMSKKELQKIVSGVLPNAKKAVNYIDFNFFGIDILHSADDQEESCRAIRSIFNEKEWAFDPDLSKILKQDN